MIKMILDTIAAFIGLLLLAPILLIVVLVIWLVERQPAFFTQERIGTHKTPFKIYKLRTMSDNKITSIGRVLRKTGIDELPQLLNILKGEMSFVGPRPLTETDIVRLGWDDTFHEKRWSIRPGIVGLAQLAPVCHQKMSWFYDRLYLTQQSLALDFKIVLTAMVIPFVGKQTVKNWIHGR